MNRMLKRMTVLLLILSMLCAAIPVQAARIDPDGREIKYGTIEVLGIGQDYPARYQAARDDKNALVYILAEDFAALTGATLSISGNHDDPFYCYSLGGWNLRVLALDGVGQLYYDFDPDDGDDWGSGLYKDFQMTDCFYDELNDCWYFPFEEMMYMMALQWVCHDGTVIIYQPETLLDILAEYDEMVDLLPSYSDLMGDTAEEIWDNATYYGFGAAIDEFDMTFLLDGVASAWCSAWGQDYYTNYEKDTMMQALLLMQSDLPSEGDAVVDEINRVSDFYASASTLLKHYSTTKSAEKFTQLMSDLLGVQLPSGFMEYAAAGGITASALLNYSLSTAQAFWIRDHVSEDLDQRLAFIQEAAEKRAEDDLFWKTLADVAGEARDTYCGEISDAIKAPSVDVIIPAVDGVLSLAMGLDWKDALSAPAGTSLNVLCWMKLCVSTLDLCIETTKVFFPIFAAALEQSENVHLCRYLIYMTSLFQKESSNSFQELLSCGGMNQMLLDDIRTGTHLMMLSSMHAHNNLNALGKYPDPGFPEQGFIARLMESTKYDRLILMDSEFTDIVSSVPGCMRHDIPIEYVRIIMPVIVTTETTRVEGTHFSATITQPHVYSEANPNLTAAVDAVLDPIYNKKLDNLENAKANAESCSMTYQTHTETAKLSAAYSNGGYLVLAVTYGYFSCNVGHDVSYTETYVFDVASGAQLRLSDLWAYDDNPNAEAEFLAVLDERMTATGRRYTLSHGPSSVTARRLYEKAKEGVYVVWDLAPEGIWFSIDMLSMDLAINNVLIPYDMLEGILKEEYLPADVGRTANCQFAPFREEMRENHTVYENTPSVNALTVQGLASNLWIRDCYGSLPDSIDGTCTYFYAFGLQNCIVSVPDPHYKQHGYVIMWQDSQGDHIQIFPSNPQ